MSVSVIRKLAGSGLLLAAALGVAGCDPAPMTPPARAAFSPAGAQAHHDVFFEPGGPRLVQGEGQRLAAFLRGLELRPQDDVLLSPGWTGSERIDGQRLAALRAIMPRVPARVLAEGRVGFENTVTLSDKGLVRVVRYDRVRVDCPVADPAIPPIGCANAVNTAHMAANLRDLTSPQVLGPTDATMAAGTIQRERDGTAPKPTLPRTGN